MSDKVTSEKRAAILEGWRLIGAPVQPDRYTRGGAAIAFPLRIPWHIHERAWSVYAAAGHGSQSAVRLAERSGFSVRELVACLALGNYHADYTKITEEHVAPVRTEIEDWVTGITALREDLRCAASNKATAEGLLRSAVARAHVGKGVFSARWAHVKALFLIDDDDAIALCAKCDLDPYEKVGDWRTVNSLAQMQGGIDWQTYASGLLIESHSRAYGSGADYVGKPCPCCFRFRLEPTDCGLECEKCGWSMAINHPSPADQEIKRAEERAKKLTNKQED